MTTETFGLSYRRRVVHDQDAPTTARIVSAAEECRALSERFAILRPDCEIAQPVETELFSQRLDALAAALESIGG